MSSADERPAIWTNVDDETLMSRVGRDDPGAFAELIHRHQRRVFSLAWRSLSNVSDAEDLTQEIFLRMYRARARYQPTARFTTWLHRIATNAIINWVRQHRRGPVELSRLLGGDDQDEPQGLLADPEAETGLDAAAREELRLRVRRAIQALPEKQRLAIILFRFEGLSYQQAADALDCSVPAVKSLLSRARENLHQRLAPYVDAGSEFSPKQSGEIPV
jgi:RNA polymerase sigma-70 factor (ECF subfamily)